jgi:superfamily I DNA/RNA helicase
LERNLSSPETITQQIDSLNSDQREVALCMGHCLTIAAPGSGKTKTLAVKAAYLLSKGNTVSAVTFTRDAAIELRDRIVALSGEESLPRLLVGTFHSIDLLMAFPKRVRSGMGSEILSKGYSRLSRQWEIVKESSRRSIVARAINASGLDLEVEEGTRIVEAIKSGHEKPETEQHAVLHKTYVDLLKRHGVIDFQDILLETNKAISNRDISPLKTDFLMIDEFQDTDRVQFKWAMLHADAGSVLTAVGDDDQSIYGFRRAMGYSGMVEFQDRLQATRVVLGMNYRSHAEVLAPSAALISINEDRMVKDLVSFKGPGGSAQWDRFGSREAEAAAVHDWAKEAINNGASVGVLARTNTLLNKIEAQCIKGSTPYVRAEGGSILQSREMGVFLAALGLLTQDSMLDADEVLAWSKVTEDEIKGIHASLGKSGFVYITKKQLDQLALSTSSKATISAILRRRIDWQILLRTGGINFVIDGVLGFLSSSVATDKWTLRGLETVSDVFRKPVGHGNGIQEMSERMERIRKLQKGNNEMEGKSTGAVSLLTAHGSKGLEYDYVWIIGAEEGTFPDKSASTQEERRLFFVGMTRARKHLMVSAGGAKPLSPFIDEAGLLRRPEQRLPIAENEL